MVIICYSGFHCSQPSVFKGFCHTLSVIHFVLQRPAFAREEALTLRVGWLPDEETSGSASPRTPGGPCLVLVSLSSRELPGSELNAGSFRVVPVRFGCWCNLVHFCGLFPAHLLCGWHRSPQAQAISCVLWHGGDLRCGKRPTQLAGRPASEVHPGVEGSPGSENILYTHPASPKHIKPVPLVPAQVTHLILKESCFKIIKLV